MKIPILIALTVFAATVEVLVVLALVAGLTLATLTSFGIITSPL